MMKANINIVKKICILGDLFVGKSSLIERYVIDVYNDIYKPTIGSKVLKKSMVLDLRPERDQKLNLTLLIFDLIGHLEFKSLLKTYFLGAEGALIVGDLTRDQTLRAMSEWHDRFYEAVGEVCVVYLGNKYDISDVGNPNIDLLAKIAGRTDSPYMLTSAKTGENVEAAFAMLAANILNRDPNGFKGT